MKENLGEAPVDSNGSAYFGAPSNCELYFIALDKDGKKIQRMGSVTQLTTGEHVSCVGCHDDRMKAPPPAMPHVARLLQPPDQLRPPPWGTGPFDYVKHVQPVWDRYCVSCHGARAPAAGVDLSGDKTRFFNMSYDYLVERNMVAYYFTYPGPTGVFPAMQSGSWVSRLTKLIETQHHEVNLDDDSRRYSPVPGWTCPVRSRFPKSAISAKCIDRQNTHGGRAVSNPRFTRPPVRRRAANGTYFNP